MKILAQFISSSVCGILLGLLGLGIGATIGGNYGFPTIGGNVGYEAGGVFFAIIGISLGSLWGIIIAKRMQKEKNKHTGIASIVALFTAIIGVILFDYHMPETTALIILLLPPISLTVATNWQQISKSLK